jgi:hypothetical protein
VPAYSSAATRPTNTLNIDIEINDPDDISDLLTVGNAGDVSSLLNIVKINDEFIGFETLTDFTTYYRMQNCYRGLFNSVQQAHAIDDVVWFVGQTGGNMTELSVPDTHDEMRLQLRSVGIDEETTEGGTPEEDQHLDRIWRQPLPVRDPVINSTYADTTNVSLDVGYVAGTGRTGEDASAVLFECTPRDWRVDNVLTDATLTAQYSALGDDPEIDYVFTLDPAGTPTALTAYTNTTPWNNNAEVYILRNDMIIALGINTAMPTTARITITPKHTPPEIGSQITSTVPLVHDFTITSELQSDDLVFGGLDVNTASGAVSFTETGIYSFNIYTALPSSGILEANVDSGGWTTVVAASNTTGTLTTSGGGPYSVLLRFTQAPTDDQFFRITGPTAETGYGVLKA